MATRKNAGFGPDQVTAAPIPRADSVRQQLGTIGRLLGSVAVPDPWQLEPPEEISEVAWFICACLIQVRNALCDRDRANVDSVNELIAKAWKSKAADLAVQALRESGKQDLVEGFEDQFVLFDDAGDFAQERRQRLFRLDQYELALLSQLHDRDIA